VPYDSAFWRILLEHLFTQDEPVRVHQIDLLGTSGRGTYRLTRDEAFKYRSDGWMQPNLYFTPAVLDNSTGTAAANCLHTSSLAFDVDFGTVGHAKRGIFETAGQARTYIQSLPLQPSFLWKTGHGFQGIYALDAPYATEIVKSWNQADGGIDIIAVRRDFGGFPVRYAIQCKRYAASRHVTADPIRALAGVLDHFRAHVGIIATTSFFTKPARDEVEAHYWKLDLRDYENIVESLKRLALLR
jgi:hypothetical protein